MTYENVHLKTCDNDMRNLDIMDISSGVNDFMDINSYLMYST